MIFWFSWFLTIFLCICCVCVCKYEYPINFNCTILGHKCNDILPSNPICSDLSNNRLTGPVPVNGSFTLFTPIRHSSSYTHSIHSAFWHYLYIMLSTPLRLTVLMVICWTLFQFLHHLHFLRPLHLPKVWILSFLITDLECLLEYCTLMPSSFNCNYVPALNPSSVMLPTCLTL